MLLFFSPLPLSILYPVILKKKILAKTFTSWDSLLWDTLKCFSIFVDFKDLRFCVETGKLWEPHHLSSSDSLSWALVAHTCYPSYSVGQRSGESWFGAIQANRLQDPMSKKPFTKRAGGVAQGVGLSSSPSTAREQKYTSQKKLPQNSLLSFSGLTPQWWVLDSGWFIINQNVILAHSLQSFLKGEN
jgi:hypothetical protein